MTPKPKSAFLTVRVPANMHMKFHIKAQRYGQPSAVLREIIEAFLDDRLSITPPVTRKESLYVTRTQD
jgi:predicted DNA-binding protein